MAIIRESLSPLGRGQGEGPVATTRGYRGGSYRSRSAGSRLVLYGLLVVVAVWLIGPFVWLFITSISYQRNLMARPLSFIPPEVTLDNYKMIFGLVRFHAEGQAAKIIPSMLNSLVVASVVTALNLVIGTTAGYAYARYKFPLKTLSLFALLFTRMLPTVVLIPAFFLMLRALALQNTLTGLVAGGAFTFMLCWNEFIVAQVLSTKPGTTTLPPVIAGMNGQVNIDYSVIAASGFLGALPAVLLVLFFQKYLVEGLTAGSVKG